MYPYLPGPASTLTLATVMGGSDVADAAARGAADRALDRARRDVRRSAAPTRERITLRTWGRRHVPHLHLHRRPPVLP